MWLLLWIEDEPQKQNCPQLIISAQKKGVNNQMGFAPGIAAVSSISTESCSSKLLFTNFVPSTKV